MQYLISRILIGLTGTVLATTTISAMAIPAHAATDTYTPNGGPGVILSGNDVSFTVVEAAQTFDCEQFDLSGTVTDPGVSRHFGANAGSLDQNSSSGCIHWSYFGHIEVAPTSAWGIAITGPKVGTVSPATLTDAAFHFEGVSCWFNVTGEVSGELDDATGMFTPTGSTLTIADVPGGYLCPIVGFEKDQNVTMSGPWNVSGLSITNP